MQLTNNERAILQAQILKLTEDLAQARKKIEVLEKLNNDAFLRNCELANELRELKKLWKLKG